MSESSRFPRQIATAIKVDPGEGKGPTLVGAGMGLLAEQIIKIAEENEIPLVKDEDLAHSLSLLEVGAELPEELFPIVAEIIAHIYHVADKHRDFPVHHKP